MIIIKNKIKKDPYPYPETDHEPTPDHTLYFDLDPNSIFTAPETYPYHCLNFLLLFLLFDNLIDTVVENFSDPPLKKKEVDVRFTIVP